MDLKFYVKQKEMPMSQLMPRFLFSLCLLTKSSSLQDKSLMVKLDISHGLIYASAGIHVV